MKVLVATARFEGAVATDFCDTIEGELVIIAGDCETADCSCERRCDASFVGLASGKRTTTAMIAHRAELDPQTYRNLLADGLRGLGLTAAEVDGHLLDLDFLVGPGQSGDVISRLGADFWRRSSAQ